MNNSLLKISGLAGLVLLLHTSGFAQQSSEDKDNAPEKTKSYEEIIIRHKGDKDAKVTIEIKDGDVLVNGKPASDFDDSSLSIHKRKFKVLQDRNFSFSSPDGNVFMAPGIGYDGQGIPTPPSPPAYGSRGGGWSYGGDDMAPASNHAFLGVSSERPSDGEGARIVGVTEGSAAEKLGLKKGDVITKINETPVTDPESLSATVRTRKPGDKVVITFTREGKVQKETATLGKTNSRENLNFQFRMPDMQNFDFNGTMPREFGPNFGNSLKFGIKGQDTEDGKGVKVLDVDDESAAAKAGIKEGDIITRFDGKEVNSATALAEAAHAAKEKASVKISLLRDGKAQEIDVKVPKRLRTANL
jgi:serine protease Do